MSKKIAIFPGSFDPYTIGHHDILTCGLQLFDEIIIGIGTNYQKQATENVEERIKHIQDIYKNQAQVRVEAYQGLTVDFAKKHNAAFILRGVRSVQDFEYERNIAEINKQLSGIETILLYTNNQYAHVSSSLVRELQAHGKDVKALLP